MKLKGKTAIVTGASRGIGACIARRFAREGARVALIAHRNREEAEAVVNEIMTAGGAARVFVADLRRVDECERLAAEVFDLFGVVDILVNNAGVFLPLPVEETTEEIWDAQVDLNLKGAFFLTRALVPRMKERGRGKIINVTSIAGIGGFPNSSAYCASKGGLVTMTKALCLELAKHGINVNALAPGNVRTDMNAALRAVEGYDEHNAALTPNGVGHLDPEEMTGAAVFLASDDADSVHGINLLVDGGWAAW